MAASSLVRQASRGGCSPVFFCAGKKEEKESVYSNGKRKKIYFTRVRQTAPLIRLCVKS